ncbi:hypothetical protein [Pinirhizobacter soli]|uniref:hypothetical protein n=1 Tax=Pinirhizobacter soli TaxID=2786953 RepID=UPI00202A308A|nr:hypothetical protein [Pinirhizobacter soli]
MPSPVSSLTALPDFSSVQTIGNPSPELFLERLFHVRNDAFERFKTDTHKVCYPARPRTGVTAWVARRDHPGSGIPRMWHRARGLCSVSASALRRNGSEKIHLSVAPDQLEKAYQCISAPLVGANCPFDDFKVVNPAFVATDGSMDADAQVTLYVHDQTDPEGVRYFLLDVGTRLDTAGIAAGSVPEGDSPLAGGPITADNSYLAFFSYREIDMPVPDGRVPLPLQTDFYRAVCKPLQVN